MGSRCRLQRSRRFWLTWLAACLVIALAPGAHAADEAWKHPDPRFAAIDAAIDDDNYTGAQKLLANLRAEAKRTGDTALQAEVLERGKEITKLAKDFEKISKHVKTLKKGPGGPKASLAVGKFYCVAKGDFERGLPLLAAGEDARLAQAAAAESERADDPRAQLAVADAWWQCAEKTSDVPERIAWQIRARSWMLKARPAASDSQRATIDQRLKQVVLVPEKIVVWNTHNGAVNDRGAEEISVSLSYQGAVVWQQTVELPFKPNEPSFVLLRPKRIRADQVRVEITKYHKQGGGLGEIEAFVGRTNIASGCQPVVDAQFEDKPAFAPSKLVDGDRSGPTGHWVTENGQAGWAMISFTECGAK